MKTNLNNTGFGLVPGLVLPLLTFFVFFLFIHNDLNLNEFIQEVIVRKVSTQVMSLCAVPNLLLFFIFIWTDKLYSARGVLMATFFIAFLVLIIKLFL